VGRLLHLAVRGSDPSGWPGAHGSVTLSIVGHIVPFTRHTATIAGDGTLAAETVMQLDDAYGIPANTVITTAIHQTPPDREPAPSR
jgi:hypothetical protein